MCIEFLFDFFKKGIKRKKTLLEIVGKSVFPISVIRSEKRVQGGSAFVGNTAAIGFGGGNRKIGNHHHRFESLSEAGM